MKKPAGTAPASQLRDFQLQPTKINCDLLASYQRMAQKGGR